MDLAVRIADALAALHVGGLTHGDLRPDNIVVTPKGQVKLLDAGLAAFTGGGSVRASARMGGVRREPRPSCDTWRPKRRSAKSGDHRADLFALGLVLYEMLTGQPAFGRAGADDTLLAILEGPAPVPSAEAANLPVELDRIVARALAKPVGRALSDGRSDWPTTCAWSRLASTTSSMRQRPFEPEPASRLWWWVAGAVAVGAALGAWALWN